MRSPFLSALTSEERAAFLLWLGIGPVSTLVLLCYYTFTT